MVRGARPRRELAFGLALALLAAPAPSAARAPEWDAGDVEAAQRYRALERERALRFRAAAEDRVAEPRRSERTRAPEPPRSERTRARAPRPERSDESRAPRAVWRALPSEREPLFEPWVSRLAQALADAVLRAFVGAAHDVWRSLREAVEAWLDDAWARERPAWTDAEWRSRE